MAEMIPAWMLSGFARSVTAVGGTAPREAATAIGLELASRWMDKQRKFHNLEFLKTTLEKVDSLGEQARSIDAIRLALWYHGAIFDVSPQAVERCEAGIDVLASADFAEQSLASLGVPAENRDKITRLIRGLYHHQAVDDIDAQVLSDADLSVLASQPEEYLDYLRDIRREYAAYSDPHFVLTRSRVVSRLLTRPQLFWTHGAASWEESARENLRAELERLEKTDTSGLSLPAEVATDPVVPGSVKAESDQAEPVRGETDGETKPNSPEKPGQETIEAAGDEENDVNPYSPPDEANLGSTLENVAEVLDTMVMKALKPAEIDIKPMDEVQE